MVTWLILVPISVFYVLLIGFFDPRAAILAVVAGLVINVLLRRGSIKESHTEGAIVTRKKMLPIVSLLVGLFALVVYVLYALMLGASVSGMSTDVNAKLQVAFHVSYFLVVGLYGASIVSAWVMFGTTVSAISRARARIISGVTLVAELSACASYYVAVEIIQS